MCRLAGRHFTDIMAASRIGQLMRPAAAEDSKLPQGPILKENLLVDGRRGL
jgi:hypothetical protein